MNFRTTVFILIFTITLIISHQLVNSKKDLRIVPKVTISELLNTISLEIANTEVDSENVKRLSRLYKKLKKNKKGETERAENPGALLEAFRQIKIAPDGKTYEGNYKLRELEKSISRKNKLLKKATPLPWVEIGPGNVSGRSRALIVDPEDETGNTWFVGTVGGGIWKTTNAGDTWENKTPELTTLSTVCMAMAGSNPNVIYAGTGMGYGRTVDLAGNGIWKSIDKGETWVNLPSTANNELLPAINRIIIDPSDENIVLVCSNGDYTSNGPNGGSRESGIFRSTNGGDSWTQVFNPETVFGSSTDNRIQQIIANPDNFNEIYGAVNEVGVIKSSDGGLTWTTVANNFANPADIGYGEGTYQGISTRVELAIAPSDPKRIYAAVERRRGISKLYMSKNSGNSWKEVIDTGTNPNWFSYYGADGANAYTGGWFNNTIVVSPYDEDVVFVGGIEVYRINVNHENNTRTTVVVAPIGTIHVDHHFLVTIPVDEATKNFRILNANDGGVGISNDGGNSWKQIRGLGSTQFYGVDKMPGANRYIGGTQDNGSWLSNSNPDHNSNWSYVIGGDGFEVAWNYWDPDKLIGCSQNGNYKRSIDGGLTWNSIPNAKAGSSAPFISKVAGSKTDADMLFTVGTDGVKRSDDFGASWTLTPISNHWIGWRAFDNVEMSIADPQVVWISSRVNYESFIKREGGIHVSKDGGLSFSEISDNFPPTVLESSGISTHPYDPAIAYFLFSAAGQPKILRTTDYGESFEDISGFSGLPKSAGEGVNGFPDVAIYQLLVMPFNNDILWAGTEIGLFISEDNGTSWAIADNGLPYVGIFQMSIVDDQVIVATYGRGIWTVKLPELANYSPPEVTLVPRLQPLAQNPSGNIDVNIELRSIYDSTLVKIDGVAAIKLNQNSSPTDTTVIFSVTEPTNLVVSISSFMNGKEYKTPERNIIANPIASITSYYSDFSSPQTEEDFISNTAYINQVSGFNSPALHFPHPYPNASEAIAQLKNPIQVAEEGAVVSFDEVVLVEEGISTNYMDAYFFDYVIVEGSENGLDWIPLVNGYDSREDPAWLSRYNSNIVGQNSLALGDESLYRNRKINLLDNFDSEDLIFIRFKLHADALAYGWGWVIDNLSIQNSISDTNSGNSLPSDFALYQNYPNPFNPKTNIVYEVPSETFVSVKVYNLLGAEIATLVNKEHLAGKYYLDFDANNIASGVYYYRLEADRFVKTKKMIVLK